MNIYDNIPEAVRICFERQLALHFPNETICVHRLDSSSGVNLSTSRVGNTASVDISWHQMRRFLGRDRYTPRRIVATTTWSRRKLRRMRVAANRKRRSTRGQREVFGILEPVLICNAMEDTRTNVDGFAWCIAFEAAVVLKKHAPIEFIAITVTV